MAIRVPEVEEQIIPSVRQSATADASTFGGGPGLERATAATKDILQSAYVIAVDEKQKSDQRVVQDASAKLGQTSNALLYDRNNGVLTSKGLNSVETRDKAWKDFRKTANEISNGLKDNEQKAAFNKYALTLGMEFDRTAMAHESKEMQIHDTNTFKSFVKNTTDFSAMTYGDATTRERSLNDLSVATDAFAKRQGMGDDQSKELRGEVLTNFHSQVIGQMLADKQDKGAKEYFKTYSDQITDSKTRDQLEKQITEGTYRGESQREADTIWKETKGDLRESLVKVTAIQDPEVRDLTRDRIKQYASDEDAAVRFEQDTNYLNAARMTEGIKDPAQVRESIPPAMWTKMGPAHQAALMRRNDNQANDSKAWMDFLDMNPAQMANLSRADFETKYWSKFDESHKTRAETQWEAAKEGKDKGAADPQLSATLTFNNRVENALRANDLIPKNKTRNQLSQAQSNIYDRFETEAASEVQNYEITVLGGKRKASGDEIQKIVDGLSVRKVFVDKTFWVDPQKSVVEITEDDKARAYVPIEEIKNPGDIAFIEGRIKASGRKVTKDKVQRAYAASLRNDRPLFDAIIAE